MKINVLKLYRSFCRNIDEKVQLASSSNYWRTYHSIRTGHQSVCVKNCRPMFDIRRYFMFVNDLKEKRRDLTQSYDKIPYTNGNLKSKVTKTSSKYSIRLRTDLGRSVQLDLLLPPNLCSYLAFMSVITLSRFIFCCNRH